MNPLKKILSEKKLVISAGTGGVGKTTLTAALGLSAALSGKKVCVVTIDPSQRLRTSLGLSKNAVETDLTERLSQVAQQSISGKLTAVIPNTGETFRDLFRSLSTNPGTLQKILENPIFEIFSREYSGANEYMALQTLYRLYKSDRYDLIILDTPPSTDTASFLKAPQLLSRFFDDPMIHQVLEKGSLFSTSLSATLKALESLTGATFLSQFRGFVQGLFETKEQFTQNLNEMTHFLSNPTTAALLITTPTRSPSQIEDFQNLLKTHSIEFSGIILNRSLSYFDLNGDENSTNDPSFERAMQIVEGFRKNEKSLFKDTTLLAKIPSFQRDVSSMEDLYEISKLF